MGLNRAGSKFVLAWGLFLGLLLPSAHAGGPKCYLHGIISSINGIEKPSISDMIRLHFDANNKAKCELMMTSYCIHNVRDKKYSPTRLKGSFKPDVSKDEEDTYTFSPKCKLLTEDD